jgi:hypothetical protein
MGDITSMDEAKSFCIRHPNAPDMEKTLTLFEGLTAEIRTSTAAQNARCAAHAERMDGMDGRLQSVEAVAHPPITQANSLAVFCALCKRHPRLVIVALSILIGSPTVTGWMACAKRTFGAANADRIARIERTLDDLTTMLEPTGTGVVARGVHP